MNWQRGLKSRIKNREPLSRRTTFKIGGRAEFFIEPRDIADLELLITSAKRYKIPILVIGAGSNILVSDRGVKAIVLHLNAPVFKSISCRRNVIEAGSGLMLGELILAARNHGLSGLEFLAGIPGTVGGALAMNAGAWGRSISEVVEKVRVMDYNAGIKTLDRKDIKFAYRRCGLARYIILSARLKLVKKTKKEISDSIKKFLGYRRDTQDTSSLNAGCIFTNPAGKSAGRLIDLCGLKGKRIGGASVSQRHANFILNQGNASSGDVLKLMRLIRKRVKDKFKVTLGPEIKIWS
jgi:UDP-N-acetylmuramate dehydrogenase